MSKLYTSSQGYRAQAMQGVVEAVDMIERHGNLNIECHTLRNAKPAAQSWAEQCAKCCRCGRVVAKNFSKSQINKWCDAVAQHVHAHIGKHGVNVVFAVGESMESRSTAHKQARQ